MAASALELRPRSALGLMDAGLRLCTRTSGVWALTLPGLTAITAALIHLMQEHQRNASLFLPGVLLGGAWLLRAFCQGAACHHLEGLLLAPAPPGIWSSYRAALGRAPSLLFAATWLTLFRVLALLGTLGVAVFLSGAPAVTWAVAMQRTGPPWKLALESRRLLGPNRGKALVIRGLFAVQVLAGLNLHLAIVVLLSLASSLLGLELAWVERAVALDNPSWVTLLVALTFGAFEPLRAASATLLLLDARVRREGADLLARLTQLSARSSARPGRTAIWLLVGGLVAVAAPGAALASPPGPVAAAPVAAPVAGRLATLAADCEGMGPSPAEVSALEALPPADHASLLRWVTGLERLVAEEEDCQEAMVQLDRGLGLALAAAPGSAEPALLRADVKAILERPEFAPELPTRATLDEDGADPDEGLLARLLRWLKEWLRAQDQPETPRIKPTLDRDGGEVMARFLLVALAIVALVIGGVVLLRMLGGRARTPGASGQPAVRATPLEPPMESALTHAPQTWVSLADALAAEGRFREAVRSVYLALLAGLHARGAILYDPHVSNWEYLQGFRGPAGQLPSFRELTHRFDFAWYGLGAVTPRAWEEFRLLSLSLLEAPAHARARDA